MLPALRAQEEVLTDPVAIRRALANHFAEPEHGAEANVATVVQAGRCTSTADALVLLKDLPSLAEVAQGWISLQDRKASGASGLPAEAYKYAAIDAARSHGPLLAKICSRNHWPLLWRGTLNVAIPKPGKDHSWRSIALAEAAY